MAKTKGPGARKAVPPKGAGQAAKTQERTTKAARVIAMLRQPGGVTLEEIASATGWQAHSIRGFLSGTAKKKLGHTLKTERRGDGKRVYSIA